MNSYFISITLIISIIFLSGCNKKNIVDDEKMVLIYTDLLTAQDTSSVENINVDSLRSIVLNKHQVSEDKYKQTIEYYNEDQKRWENFFSKVTKHIEKLAAAEKKENKKEN